MLLHDIQKKNLINAPQWILDNTVLLCITGSTAYGCDHEHSDWDLYGIVIPPKDQIFPHLRNEIQGFGTQKQRFEQFLAPHILDRDALGGRGREYDVTIFNIVKMFNLLLQNNINVLDSIFVSRDCIIHSTTVGEIIRENRKVFLHKGVFHKTKGYAYAQLNKMKSKEPSGKRKEIRDRFGFDVKFGMNVVRLLLECEDILSTEDLDLRKHSEVYKSIMRGEWSEQKIMDFFTEKEKFLEKLYEQSKLPWGPNEESIKTLLLQCLEHHYGSLDKCIVNPNAASQTIGKIAQLIEEYNRNAVS